MGLFDRWLKASPSQNDVASNADEVARTKLEATRMLEEGMAFEKQGKVGEALKHYEAVIRLTPEMARAHFNRGNILLDRGDAASALDAYEKATEFNPDSAAAHYNMGNAHISLGNSEAGIAAYRQAIALKPDFVDAHYQLGIVFYDLGRFESAINSFRQAIAVNSSLAAIHNNLGNAFKELERFDDAIASYNCALKIEPQLSPTHNNLGLVYREAMRFSESIESYNRAISIAPDLTDAYTNLGNVLKDLGRMDESLMTLEQALQIDPDCATAHNHLLFIHNYVADQPAELLLADARRFGETAARLARPYIDWPNLPAPERRLRVGFVSGDLCSHPVGYFLEDVLNKLAVQAHTKLELFAYPTRIREDATIKRLRACFESWYSAVGLSDEALAQRIRDDGIDILIDLSGHTAHNRLPVFAWKPAPVQVSWLGYFATTGVAAMDYFIADPWTLPPDQEAYFTEQIWRLPETRLCFTPPDAEVAVGPLPALANGYVTFGCFNNLSKMNDAVVALWAQVLYAVPGSRLFLKYQQLGEASVRQSTCERFAVHGIDAGRLIFEDYVPRANYLAAYQRVDIALDPFPFPGGTTTVEALWMGVPVLTLTGERFLSRQGIGLLMNAGLPEWVATDPRDYVARAVAHASDLQGLALLRSGLRQQVLDSPLFDASRFAQHFEAALRGMWQIWCDEHTQRQRLNLTVTK